MQVYVRDGSTQDECNNNNNNSNNNNNNNERISRAHFHVRHAELR